MEGNVVLGFPAQTPCLVKFLFLNRSPECSHPVRWQSFLKVQYLQKELIGFLNFLYSVRYIMKAVVS